MAGVPGNTLSQAKGDVERIFLRANVRIEWLYCSGVKGQPTQPCPPRPAGTIIVRIVPAALDFIGPSALGYAGTGGVSAVYATVSFRRVEICALGQSTSSAGLGHILGHAMAHEIGHVLLGENSHSSLGLMRPWWDAHVLDEIAKGFLCFAREQAVRVERAVRERAQIARAALSQEPPEPEQEHSARGDTQPQRQ